MSRKLMYLVSFVAAVLSLISNVRAGEATADAYIRGSANADTNYGTEGSLLIKNNNGGNNDRKTYIRFDVSGTIMDASLDLTVSTNNEGGGGTTPQTFTVEVFGLAESLDHTWTETEITWNNAPGNTTTNHDFNADATMLGSFLVDQLPAGDTVTFSDPALVDFINADTDNQITLLLRRTTGNGSHNLGFASKDHSSYNAPTLNTIAATRAFSPTPADGAFLDETWVNLSWRGMDSAVSHDVYISENFEDVKNGTPGAPGFVGNQRETMLVIGFPGFPFPDGLVPGTTYYWRIDEVNEAEPDSPWTGSVWSFSIAPNTAYNPDPADGAEFAATDTKLSWTAGYGAKLHTVYFGDDYDAVDSAAGGLPQGTTTYNPGPLQEEKVYYWRVDEFDIVETHKGDIWGFTTPGAAGSLRPANGAVDVQMNSQITWIPATSAVSHDVYFGTDKDAVRNATTASPEFKGNKAAGSESYDPGTLAWSSDYYLRIDAVYNTGTVKGLVWSFTTTDYLLVDDFESYNDLDPPDAASNRIFDKWIDGFGTTDNGALVGNDMPPYAEQMIVHGGNQSMIYRYDNTGKTSEATLTLVYPRDWTEEGVTNLSLWFRGAPANAADKMYIALNGSAVVYHENAAATQRYGWNQWIIDLQEFANQGVNLANVNTMTIGIGTKGSPAAGGPGTMHFDDIRLSR